MDEQNQLSFIDILSVLGVIVQLADYEMNIKQTSNDELLKELQHQNEEYLEKILKGIEEIKNMLSDLTLAY